MIYRSNTEWVALNQAPLRIGYPAGNLLAVGGKNHGNTTKTQLLATKTYLIIKQTIGETRTKSLKKSVLFFAIGGQD